MQKVLELQVMFRRNVGYHQCQQFKIFRILLQFCTPGLIVHISQIDFHLFAYSEVIGVAVLHIKVIFGRFDHINVSLTVFFIVINGFDCASDQVKDSHKCQVEGVHRAFQPL